MRTFLENCYIEQVSTAILAAGSTEHIGAVVDTLGYESIAFITSMGVIATTAGTGYVKIQMCTSSDGTFTDIEGSTAAFDAGQPNTKVVNEIHRPKERWLKPIYNRATQNITILDCTAIKFNPNFKSVTQSTADVVASVSLNSPTTG